MSSKTGNKTFTRDNIIVGIVTFNPEVGRLEENIAAVSKQECKHDHEELA